MTILDLFVIGWLSEFQMFSSILWVAFFYLPDDVLCTKF